MKKRHSRRDKTKNSILKKSEILFAKQGFEKTTVRQIAQASRVNVATIFYYFKTKEILHQEIFETGFSKLNDSLEQALKPHKKPDEKIKDIIHAFISFLQQYNNIHQIILRETVNRSKHLELIINKYISKKHNMIAEIIKEGMKKGVLRKDDPSLCTFNLVGMILFYFTYDPIIEKLDKKKNLTNFISSHIFNTFMHGMKKRKD